MEKLTVDNRSIPIVDHFKPDGTRWTLREKLWLGLTPRQYRQQFFRNWVNWLMIGIFAVGIPLILQRYIFGLGSITHGSNDYPWGLFLGFGLFSMVPLSASGFVLGTTVDIFGRKDFAPVERLALLNGLLGYFFAVVYLLVDLGLPWRLPYPLFISPGPAAVLFLVGWHVALYLSVQIVEMIPAFGEWSGWLRGKRWARSITLGLTIAAIMLSTLHQGALGALFTYAPGKVHPLWYSSEFQWIHFLCSSIFAGLSMVIVSSTLCKWTLKWRADERFLKSLDTLTIGLGKGCAFALITYLAVKIVSLAQDQEWSYLLTGWGQYYLLEMGVGVLLPMWLFAVAVRNRWVGLVRFAAFLSVLSVIWNRINTSMIAFNWKLYQEIPSWQEVWVSITLFALYFLVYRFILYRLPVLYEWKGEK
ncbi:MAG TPA: polysulfide reductase [Desulfobulbaceae bacterium]|nr:polysulfide reductase [Desulfobulbaceae bacterium]